MEAKRQGDEEAMEYDYELHPHYLVPACTKRVALAMTA